MNNHTIYSNLVFAQNAIANAMEHETVKTALSALGYNADKLQEGMALYDNAVTLHEKQQKEYGEQYAATEALTAARVEANKKYKLHLNIARIALRDDRDAAISLKMIGQRNRTFTGWLEQAKVFYANALKNDKILAALAAYMVSAEKLEEAQAEIDGIEQLYNQQLREKGDAQAATKERDKAFDTLQAWMSDYKAIARLALDGQSQYLEVLGIVEPS